MKENNRGKTGKAILLAAVLLLAGGRPAWAAEEDAAYLQSFKGNVEILFDEEDSEWEPAEKSLYLYEGSEVRVGPGGEAVIKWERGHVMKLFALSSVKIEKLKLNKDGKSENSMINVETGKIFTKTNKLLSKKSVFAVKTPTAVAGVRGTKFMIHVAQDHSSVISLLEGKLEVVGENIQMLLEENMQVEIPADFKTPPEPTPLPAEIRTEMEAESGALDTSAEPGAGAVDEDGAETEAKDESGSAGAAETSQTGGTEMPIDIEGAQQTVEDVINNVAAGAQEQTADQAPDVPPMPPPR